MPSTSTTSSGPALVWVGPSAVENGLIYWSMYPLGWCEVSPEVIIEGAHARLFNTLGGVQVEYFTYQQGAESQLACRFTKWDEFRMIALKNAFVNSFPIPRFSIPYNRFGLCVIIFMPLGLFMNPNKDYAWSHPTVMVFPTCRIAELREHDMSTGPSRVTIVFHAMRSHVQMRGPDSLDPKAGYGFGSMTLGAYGGIGISGSSNITPVQGDPLNVLDGKSDDLWSAAMTMWGIMDASHVYP